MGRGDLTRVDQRIKSVNSDLGASEPQHGCATLSLGQAGHPLGNLPAGSCGSERRKGEERGPKHFE